MCPGIEMVCCKSQYLRRACLDRRADAPCRGLAHPEHRFLNFSTRPKSVRRSVFTPWRILAVRGRMATSRSLTCHLRDSSTRSGPLPLNGYGCMRIGVARRRLREARRNGFLPGWFVMQRLRACSSGRSLKLDDPTSRTCRSAVLPQFVKRVAAGIGQQTGRTGTKWPPFSGSGPCRCDTSISMVRTGKRSSGRRIPSPVPQISRRRSILWLSSDVFPVALSRADRATSGSRSSGGRIVARASHGRCRRPSTPISFI